MTTNALEIPTKPYTGEKARLSRAYDYLILVLALFLFIGVFHLHVALTVGDWDFWVDWKDRQWWPLVTPLMMITFPAAVQSLPIVVLCKSIRESPGKRADGNPCAVMKRTRRLMRPSPVTRPSIATR